MIPVSATIAEVRLAIAAARGRNLTVGLVPTMGALHAGHAALIRAAKARCGFVVVSVFVNPTQFGPAEDFARYPRTPDADRTLSAAAGADVLFAPAADDMYPAGSVTAVEVPGPDQELCGPVRPGHFRGVATVVLKLLNIVQPDAAVFGAKDAQQVRVVAQMVRDLNLPVEVIVAPTVREADGLAMSSRNRYLTPADRAAAPDIYAALLATRAAIQAGSTDVAGLEADLSARLGLIPGAAVEYARVVDDATVRAAPRADRPVLVACAVRFGSTRLIDNVTAP